MTTQIQRRRGTTAQHSTFTGAVGEVTVDTDKEVLVVHDGAQVGGYPQMRENGSNSALALGSAGTPSLKFTGDPNTGIYSPGADQVAISTGGSGRLFVDASGNIGVGTTTAPPAGHIARFSSFVFAPGFTVNSSGDTGIYSTIANTLQFQTNGSEKVRIDSSGRLLVGVSSTSGLQTGSRHFFGDGSGGGFPGVSIGNPGGGLNNVDLNITAWSGFGSNYFTSKIRQIGDGSLTFQTQATSSADGAGTTTERARIDSSGRLLVGTSTARANLFNTSYIARFQLEGTDYASSSSSLICNSLNDNAFFVIARSRGSAVGSNTIVASGDRVGGVSFQGSDGTEFVEAANIECYIDGTPGANNMPGRIVLSTTANGAASPTERMRITSSGTLLFGKQIDDIGTNGVQFFSSGLQYNTRSGGTLHLLNRRTDDGDLIVFAQDGNIEGSISVSGTTISYNGAHLSRWSQLPSGAERTEILRGTVLSNIDEMCEWGEEDNEQLNRMKVSDVEGDKNVSGVFQAWDDDDDTYTNDFYCAMTGDFIIRIGAGVTVERGDLLMSAGDGTAKPQDDDIIRSKTIAKVTSTNVSCTHPDGSYCVPCVLMAC